MELKENQVVEVEYNEELLKEDIQAQEENNEELIVQDVFNEDSLTELNDEGVVIENES